MDSAVQQLRNHGLQLAIANQRIASHDGQMQRPHAVDQFQHAVNERLSLSIAQAAQGGAAAQMRVVVRITSRTLQRTLTGNFDGKRGAVAEKNAAATQVLIDRGADVNAQTHKLPPPTMFQTIFSAPFPVGGMTALLYAARQNDLESARILVTAGANVKESAADGSSPLLVAIINEHYALAKYLLEQGADPNATDDKGRGPLYAAIDMRNLEWSTRPAPPEKDTLSDLDLINALLDHGANPNARLTKKIPLRGQPSFDGRWANAIGATPFWRAAQSDDVTVMKLLKARGADPLIATKDHTTPLMVAAGVGWSDGQSHGSQADAPEALKLCLGWGGDVNAVNDEGYTALHGASFRGANDVVEFLVDHGAKMDVKSKEGRLPVNMAEGMHIGPGGWVEHDDTVALFHKLMAQKQ